MLGLFLVWGGEVSPEICDDFSHIDARNLTNILLGVGGHKDEEVFKSLDFLKVLFENSGRFLDYVGVWLEERAKEKGHLVGCVRVCGLHSNAMFIIKIKFG